MQFVVLGWPPAGLTLRLDYRYFAYAGKFVMSNTGKAVVRETGESPDGIATATDADSEAIDGDGSEAIDGDGSEAIDGDDSAVVGALAFNADRTDESTLWYRYITVRSDAKGFGLGPKLAAFVAPRAHERGYERIRIAVNNPFAYEAMYKAGFGWTGEETGVAELVLERPASPKRVATTPRRQEIETYRSGLDRYRARDLGEPEASFLRARIGAEPPVRCDAPTRPDNPEG